MCIFRNLRSAMTLTALPRVYRKCIWLYIRCMASYSRAEHALLSAVSGLAYCNPFLPDRIEYERKALGDAFESGSTVWSASVIDPDAVSPNIARLHERLEPLVESLPARLASAPRVRPEELAIYEECVHHLLYQRYYPQFVACRGKASFYRPFLADLQRLCAIEGRLLESAKAPAHLFACFWQVQRAFHSIFDNIIGSSMPAARLRASVWQSIFTHDMRRYRRSMFERMSDFPTLITGPSGTGKELVARAIAAARYIPFDERRLEFATPESEAFFPINLAALSPTLIESELFGHRRGAFTGAIGDRKGWLEACPQLGSVFLDELGEMDLSIQVKLLRVIETRRFAPVGDTVLRQFRGKLIAATNRDLPEEIEARRFREDLYYRLCADLIRTPSLKEQLDDAPGLLRDLLHYMLRRAVGSEAEQCLDDVEEWVAANLPPEYPWPGNYRELEQCVRNVVIRGSYHPLNNAPARTDGEFLDSFREGKLTAEQVLSYYAALVYGHTGSYEETARRLGIDRRTAKAKVERHLERSTTPGSEPRLRT
jgi:transcriptional regulator with AAA-type ATPase domain